MTLLTIITLGVLTHTVFTSARMIGSLYALANGASTFTVGVLMALFALVPMLIAVRAGRWLDAVGPRRPLAAGAAVLGVGAVMPALFPYAVADIAPLLVGAALIGTGSMLIQQTTIHIVGSRADPTRRAADFSLMAVGASVAGLIGPVASGLLIDFAGHRTAFATLTLLTVANGALLYLHRAQLPSRSSPHGRAEPRPTFELLSLPDVRNVLVAVALISMSWDLQTFMMPVHGTAVGLSASEIGLVLGAFAVATFAVRLAMPFVSRRLREWQVLTFTLFTSALAFVLMPWFGSVLPLAACSFLLGLGLGAAYPNVMSLLHGRSPEGRVGEALGLRHLIMNSSHVLLPLVFGAAGSLLGARIVFLLMAAALVAGGIAARRVSRTPR
jgi:predicted MFS family arabinose efflux permease